MTKNPKILFAYLASRIYAYLWLHRGWEKGGLQGSILRTIRRFYPNHMSHRSDFTDPEVGALYTGKMEGWSESAFEQLLENIDKDQPEPWHDGRLN